MQVVLEDVLGNFEQPGREGCEILSVMGTRAPRSLEGPRCQFLDVRLAPQPESKVVVDARCLVGIDGVPIQLVGSHEPSDSFLCCLLKGHMGIYRAGGEVSHRRATDRTRPVTAA